MDIKEQIDLFPGYKVVEKSDKIEVEVREADKGDEIIELTSVTDFFPGYKVKKDADHINDGEGTIQLVSSVPQLDFQKIKFSRSGKSLSDNSDSGDYRILAGCGSLAELYNNRNQIKKKYEKFLLAFPCIVLEKGQTNNEYIPFLRWIKEWCIGYWPIENLWLGDIRIVCHKFSPPKGFFSEVGEVELRVIIFEEYIDIKKKIIDTRLAVEAKTEFAQIGENVYAKIKGHSWKDDYKDSDYHTWIWQTKEGNDKEKLIFVLGKKEKE